jgi:hypothetical protein
MKKIVALLLALVMMLSVMSFASAEEPFVLTVMLPDFYPTVDFMAEDNPVLKAIEDDNGEELLVTIDNEELAKVLPAFEEALGEEYDINEEEE